MAFPSSDGEVGVVFLVLAWSNRGLAQTKRPPVGTGGLI